MSSPIATPPIPSLDTERLILRGHALSDFADSLAMWSDPLVTRFIGGGRPSTEEEVWTRLLRYVGHWALLGFGYWAVREKASGKFVGEVGFADLKREISPSIKGTPETGWVLSPSAHGRGLATEAVRAILAWAETHFEAPRTVCLIALDNLPSIRVAHKVGYREILRTTYKDAPTLMLAR